MIAEPKKVTVRQLDELKALENRRSGEYEMLSRPAPELLALWKWQAPAGFIEDFDNGLVQFELRSFLVNWSGAGLYRTPQNLAVSVDPDIIRVVLKPTLNEYCLNPIWLTLSLIKKSR